MRQPFSGTAEPIFMKLLLNDSEEHVVCITVPKWRLGPQYFFWGGLKTEKSWENGDLVLLALNFDHSLYMPMLQLWH